MMVRIALRQERLSDEPGMHQEEIHIRTHLMLGKPLSVNKRQYSTFVRESNSPIKIYKG
jgi:hypothetical protein